MQKKLFLICSLMLAFVLVSCENVNTKYVINFVTNGGTEMEQIVLLAGDDLIEPEAPTRADYKFAGWYEDVYLTKLFVFPSKMPAKSFNLYASWTERDRILTFNTNEGSSIKPISAPALENISMPENPTKEKRLFGGWYFDEEFTMPFDNVMPIYDATIHAKWVNVEPTTKLVLSSNWTSGDPNAYEFIRNDSEVTINVLAGKDTYSYIGITINQNIKAYSTFVMEISGTSGEDILLKCQNGGVVATEQVFTMNGKENQKIVWTVLEENLTDGSSSMNFYIFVRPGKLGGENVSLTIKSLELYRLCAEDEPYQSVIHFNTMGGSRVDSLFAVDGAQVYEPGEVPSKPGYRFVGWYIDEDCTEEFVFDTMPSGQTTVFAKWQSNDNVTLSFDSVGGTTVDDIVLPEGSKLSDIIPSDPIKEGTIFGGWYIDEGYQTIFEWNEMPSLDIKLYARWVVLEESTAIQLSNQFTTKEDYLIINNEDGSVTIKINTKTTYSMFTTLLELYAKDYSYFQITFTGTKDRNILFKCQNGGVTAVETRVLMTGEEQMYLWKVNSNNLPNGTSPMNFYMCLDPGIAHSTVPETEISVTINSIKLYRTITEDTEEQRVIHFNTNGGTEVKPLFLNVGERIVFPTEPVKKGYQFSGWYLSLDGEEFLEQVMPNENLCLTAKWTQITNIEEYKFNTTNWGIVTGYSNYTVNLIDNIIKISYNHKDNTWNAGAGATYSFEGLTADKLHYTQLKMNIKLTETTKTDDIFVRFRFFTDEENYKYNGSVTPTLQSRVLRADLGKDIDIVLSFDLITNVSQMNHLLEMIESENFNMLINIYTTSSAPNYGSGELYINSIKFC